MGRLAIKVLTILLSFLLGFLLVGLLVLGLLGLIWYLSPNLTSSFPYVVPKTGLSVTERKDFMWGAAAVVQALAVILAGAAGLIGLFFTWQQLRQAREGTQKTLALTEQGQITERFTRAIDQLGATDDKGNKKLEIRLGGIYALEQIARDQKEDYYGQNYGRQIIRVLNAYIREHSHWKNLEREEDQLPQDIQAALSVLGSLLHYQVEEEGERVDLSYTDLRGCNLAKVSLKSANLRGAHLEKASLREVHLEKADLHLAHLERAELIAVNLREADLSRANLTQAAALSVNLEKANLNLAILDGAFLQGADFSQANLEAATLNGALLQGIRSPNQNGLEEKRTDLREARCLREEQIIRANGDDTTLLPEDLLPKPKWWRKVPSVSLNDGDPLSPGEYSINVLNVALSFAVDEGWYCSVARWPDMLQIYGHDGALEFAKIKAVYDLSNPASASTLATMPNDLITWLQAPARPYLRTEGPFPVTIGGVSGTAIDVLVATSPAPPVPPGFHQPGVPFCRLNFDDKLIGSKYALLCGIKSRLMFLKVRGEAVTVIFDAPEDRFDEAFPKAKEVLDHVEWPNFER